MVTSALSLHTTSPDIYPAPYLLKERDIAIGYAPFLIYNGQTLRHYYFWRKIPIPYMSLLLRQ